MKERLVRYESQRDIVPTQDMLFSQFMLDWLEVVKVQVEPNTYNTYKLVVENLIAPYFKATGVKLQKLQAIHIQKFYSKKLRDGVTANTVKHYHANIHKALNYAVKMRMLPYNPASMVELPKKKKYVGKCYTEEQTKKLIAAVKDTNIETAILFAVSYGLRRSEVLGIKWDAIDFNNKTVTIKHTVVGNGKHQVRADKTKNKSSFRTLPLIAGVEQHLLQIKAHQEALRNEFGNKYKGEGYVSTWDDGSLIQPDYLTKQFYMVCENIGLERIRFHDLRHSAASMLLAEGFSLKEVSEFLGHCDIGTTANIYGHLQYQSKVNMGNRMNEMLLAPEEPENESA
ncbi:site-specific integrase [Ruminococcaceae bacterium OttesenSCG-928-A11]|nr:site-specific integrase [Ruminococcaceae bacterium OttesenSCG-928-A11]